MKHAIPFFLLLFVISCDHEINCNSGIGARTVIAGEGKVVHHPGFDRLVIRYHLPGTIDSFHTYVPCNLPDSFSEGMEVQFEGSTQKLDEKNEPLTQIAGEEFFVLFITSAEESV